MSRAPNTTTDGSAFDEKTIEAVWEKGTPEPGRPTFRRDSCGALIERSRYGKEEKWGWEIDHDLPVSRGGTDDPSNLKPLQWENNRHKGNNHLLWSCKVRS